MIYCDDLSLVDFALVRNLLVVGGRSFKILNYSNKRPDALALLKS